MRLLLRMLLLCFLITIPVLAHSQSSQTLIPQKELKIISWNVHMIPTATHKNKRAIEINKFLRNENADVILLQECFSKRIIRKISAGYKYVIKPKHKFLKLNSGLLVLSNQPLHNYQYWNYKSKKGIDALCNKGAISFEILVEKDSTNKTSTGLVKIVNTHLQNNFAHITIAQINELKLFSTGSNIIGGDFNCKDFKMLSDTFHMNVTSTGPTFAKDTIDFIFTIKTNTGKSYSVNSNLSDHNPVILIMRPVLETDY